MVPKPTKLSSPSVGRRQKKGRHLVVKLASALEQVRDRISRYRGRNSSIGEQDTMPAQQRVIYLRLPDRLSTSR
jgi:hypothetical protein